VHGAARLALKLVYPAERFAVVRPSLPPAAYPPRLDGAAYPAHCYVG
jgi:hypothetical protein